MNDMSQDFFCAEGPLSPGDAAVALLVLDDGRYLMQLRDQKPGIFYPGHWGCFGGALDLGETPEAALRRELREELGVDVGACVHFTEFSFDFSPLGARPVVRRYYEARMEATMLPRLVLGEGAAMRAFDGRQLLACERVTPYDALAIWMHLARAGGSNPVAAERNPSRAPRDSSV
jgi:8-oxo-dGTP pyrophosphatase MutT (NUDIX family)